MFHTNVSNSVLLGCCFFLGFFVMNNWGEKPTHVIYLNKYHLQDGNHRLFIKNKCYYWQLI